MKSQHSMQSQSLIRNSSKLISQFNDSDLEQQLRLEKIDSLNIFRTQSVTAKQEEPLFIQLLKKQQKTPQEEYHVYDRIRSMLNFNLFLEEGFKGMDLSEQVKLLSKAKYNRFSKNEVVFKQGDNSNHKLYIILSGSVILHIQDLVDFEKGEQEEQEYKRKIKPQVGDQSLLQSVNKFQSLSQVKHQCNQTRKMVLLSSQNSRILVSENQVPLFIVLQLKNILRKIRIKHENIRKQVEDPNFNEKEQKKQDNDTQQQQNEPISSQSLEDRSQLTVKQINKNKKLYGSSKLKVLTKGNTFGIQALINNKKRSASIVIDREGTELLTIDKRDFMESLSHLKVLMKKRQDMLIKTFPGIESLSYQSQLEVMYSFEPISLQFNDKITEENLESDQIQSISQLDQQQQQKENKESQYLYFIQQGEVILEKVMHAQGSPPYHRFSHEEPLHLATLGPGELIGDEIFFQQEGYQFSSTVTSPKILVLQIHLKTFKTKFPREIFKKNRALAHLKWEKRLQKFMHYQNQLQENFDNPVNLYSLQKLQEQQILSSQKTLDKSQIQANTLVSQQKNINNPKQVTYQFQETPQFQMTEGDKKLKAKYDKSVLNNLQEKDKQRKKGEIVSFSAEQENVILQSHQNFADKNKYKMNKTYDEDIDDKSHIENYMFDFGKGQVKSLQKNIKDNQARYNKNPRIKTDKSSQSQSRNNLQSQQKSRNKSSYGSRSNNNIHHASLSQDQNSLALSKLQPATVSHSSVKLSPRIAQMWQKGQASQQSHLILKKQQSFKQIFGELHYQSRNFYHNNQSYQESRGSGQKHYGLVQHQNNSNNINNHHQNSNSMGNSIFVTKPQSPSISLPKYDSHKNLANTSSQQQQQKRTLQSQKQHPFSVNYNQNTKKLSYQYNNQQQQQQQSIMNNNSGIFLRNSNQIKV